MDLVAILDLHRAQLFFDRRCITAGRNFDRLHRPLLVRLQSLQFDVLQRSRRQFSARQTGRLSVSMAWPARLDNQCMLRLGFEGVVLRTHGSLVVLTIERPEFRTAGKITPAAREEIAAMTSGIGALYPT